MKIAALSDIHGNLAALQAVLDDIEHEHPDVIVNLGDILSGPLLPAETANFLMPRGFVTIAGNHERQLLKLLDAPRDAIDPGSSDGYAATQVRPEHVAWLRTLPAKHWLAGDVLLVHGTPGSDVTYWLESLASPSTRPATAAEAAERLHTDPRALQASLVLCGHTHVPRQALVGGTLVVNPGSVGLQAYEDDHGGFHRVENGTPHARYAIVEKRSAGWAVRQCSVAYNWAPMQALAAKNGRPDWAYALATGRMPASAMTMR